MSVSALKERPARPARPVRPNIPPPYRGGSEKYDLDRKKGREHRRERRERDNPPSRKPYKTPKPGTPGYTPRNPKPSGASVPKPLRAWATRNYGRPTFGRDLRRLGRSMPAARFLDLIDFIDDLIRRDNGALKTPVPNPANGWRLRGSCAGRNLGEATHYRVARGSPIGEHPWHASTDNCLSGQADTGGATWPGTITASDFVILLQNRYITTGGFYYRRNVRSYSRPGPVGQPYLAPQVIASWAASPDPNMQRYVPSAQPEPEPQTQTQAAPDLAVPADVQVVFDGAGRRIRQPLATRRHRRAPPQRNEREGKVLTGLTRLAVAVYRVLDSLSEGAEVIDSLYDALPDDVKRRWDRPDRPGDQFGQYGLEGADWKAQALYYNWHRLDVEAAFKNLVKNHVSDKVIGAYQRHLPRNAGNAHEAGEKEFARFLDSLLGGGDFSFSG